MTLWGLPVWGWLTFAVTVAGLTLLHARKGRVRGPLSVGVYALSVPAFVLPILLFGGPRSGFAANLGLAVVGIVLSASLDLIATRLKRP